MADVKWIKLDVNIFDNRKIRLLESMPDGSQMALIWLKLLCLAGQVNDNGMIYVTPDVAFTDQTLATMFNCSVTNINLALTAFEQFGMIEVVDDILHVSNWERYQNIDGMERIKEQNRIRQKNWYDRQKALPNVRNNVSLTQPNATDIDKDKNKNKTISKDIGEKRKRFEPPTIEQLEEYIKEKNYNVNAEKFFYFYESKGWMVGKNKMKSWKAAVSTWNKTEIEDNARFKKEDPFEAAAREAGLL